MQKVYIPMVAWLGPGESMISSCLMFGRLSNDGSKMYCPHVDGPGVATRLTANGAVMDI